MTIRIAFVFFAIVLLAALSVTFQASMPTWCANPEGSGNWLIQPWCNK